MRARRATPEHAEAMAQIYNLGIENRAATFETRLRSAEDIRAWFAQPRHPVAVAQVHGGSRSRQIYNWRCRSAESWLESPRGELSTEARKSGPVAPSRPQTNRRDHV